MDMHPASPTFYPPPPPTFPSGFELSKRKLQAETIKILLKRLSVELLPFCGTQGKEYAKAQT
jgi:hypothetical protein